MEWDGWKGEGVGGREDRVAEAEDVVIGEDVIVGARKHKQIKD